jgi:pimeloyl-ACP methyl ester carboxylesterase
MRASTISTTDGRRLGVLEAGDLKGKPVVVHSGTPASKLPFPPWIRDAERHGIRLISYDRPGYSDSTARPGRTVADAPQDVADVADALGVERFGVVGASGGGPHALACAALLPKRVTGAAVLASVAPYPADGLDWLAGMGDDNIAEFNAALNGNDALEKFLTDQVEELRGVGPEELAEALRSLLSPADTAALTGEVAEYLHESFLDAVRGGIDGWRDDDIAFTKDWGFELDDIKVPILLWHGVEDKFVPVSHGKWLAEHIPGVTAHVSDTDGHITIAVNRINEVNAWLLDQD